MTQRSLVSEAVARSEPPGDLPSQDVVAFIRYCHRRRGATWPELYDEMCGVAARREFNGWDSAELEARGLTFSLFEMSRLAGWTRTVLADEPRGSDRPGSATPRLQPSSAVA